MQLVLKLLGWFGVGASSLQTILIAGGVLIGSILLSGGLAYNAGWRNADNAHQAAVAVALAKHAEWLKRMGDISGALATDDRQAEISNDDLQRKLEDAIGKASDGAVCFPSDFLRGLDELR